MVKNRLVYANNINDVAEKSRAGVASSRFIFLSFFWYQEFGTEQVGRS